MAEFSCMLLVIIHLAEERKCQQDIPALLKNVECSCPRRQSNNLEMGQATINSNNINTFTNLKETIFDLVHEKVFASEKLFV